MTGYRLSSGHVVHIFPECLDNHPTRPNLQEVTLCQEMDGTIRLLDDLTKIPVTVRVCKSCLSRCRAAGVKV